MIDFDWYWQWVRDSGLTLTLAPTGGDTLIKLIWGHWSRRREVGGEKFDAVVIVEVGKIHINLFWISQTNLRRVGFLKLINSWEWVITYTLLMWAHKGDIYKTIRLIRHVNILGVH